MKTYTTKFARKPCTRKDVIDLIGTATRLGQGFGERSYFIAMEITLNETDWNDLMTSMLDYRDWLKEYNKVAKDQYDRGIMERLVPCLLVKNEINNEALVIDTQGCEYPRYVAFHTEI